MSRRPAPRKTAPPASGTIAWAAALEEQRREAHQPDHERVPDRTEGRGPGAPDHADALGAVAASMTVLIAARCSSSLLKSSLIEPVS
jgi:hypothetical protein